MSIWFRKAVVSANKDKNEVVTAGPSHLVLRAPEFVLWKGKRHTVAALHNAVVATQGSALIGKFGHPGTSKRASSIAAQIESGNETRLFLIYKKQWAVFCELGDDVSLFCGKKPLQTTVLIPEYYRDQPEQPTLWIKISDKLESCSIDNLYLKSNGRSLHEVIKITRTSSMLVEKKTLER